MYLVRSIQQSEEDEWIDQLGVDPGMTLPLPVIPRRSFDKVVVIHGERALGFKLDHIEEVDEDVVVGSRDSVRIKARSQIHVTVGPRRVGKAHVPGFQGIRYVRRWSDVAR